MAREAHAQLRAGDRREVQAQGRHRNGPRSRRDRGGPRSRQVPARERPRARGPEASFAADGRPQSPQRSANFSSRFHGVSADKREGVKPGSWKAQISVGSVSVDLGYFTGPTGEVDAARAYDKYVRDHGLGRKTNFDD